MSGHDDFWTSLMAGQHSGQDSFGGFLSRDDAQMGKLSDLYDVGEIEAGEEQGYFTDLPMEAGGEYFSQVQNLTDKFKNANAIYENPEAGTKVKFVANLGTVLAYDDIPDPNTIGTVVAVRSAGGDVTEFNGFVFTQWPDGKVRQIDARHLRFVEGPTTKTASQRKRVASLGELDGFLKVSSDTLVHKSTRDLWSYREEGGEFVIERLFQDNGQPLKV